MFKDISNKIVGKIKDEKIALQPKVFDYKSLIFWLIFTFLIVLGGLTVSLILFAISFEKDNFLFATGGFLKTILISIPYIWIILFGMFAYFGLKTFRLTAKGYRYSFILILLVIFLASFCLGSFIHILGVNKRMNQFMSDQVPFFHHIAPTKEGQWARPEMGMLGGRIIETRQDSFVIENFRDKKILVIYSEKSLIDENVKLNVGEMVRVVGKKTDRQVFQADIIQSWDGDFKPRMNGRMRGIRFEN